MMSMKVKFSNDVKFDIDVYESALETALVKRQLDNVEYNTEVTIIDPERAIVFKVVKQPDDTLVITEYKKHCDEIVEYVDVTFADRPGIRLYFDTEFEMTLDDEFVNDLPTKVEVVKTTVEYLLCHELPYNEEELIIDNKRKISVVVQRLSQNTYKIVEYYKHDIIIDLGNEQEE